jgi:hypothetical protein
VLFFRPSRGFVPTAPVSQATPHAPVRRVGSHDRVFYGSVAMSMALMPLVGFAPTFYLRLFWGGPMATFGGGRPFTPLIYIHGALFTAWVALFIVQTAQFRRAAWPCIAGSVSGARFWRLR